MKLTIEISAAQVSALKQYIAECEECHPTQVRKDDITYMLQNEIDGHLHDERSAIGMLVIEHEKRAEA